MKWNLPRTNHAEGTDLPTVAPYVTLQDLQGERAGLHIPRFMRPSREATTIPPPRESYGLELTNSLTRNVEVILIA